MAGCRVVSGWPLAVAIGLALALSGATARAADRVALVIGNAAYPGAARLNSPAVSSLAVAAALRRLGFAVTVRADLNGADMRQVIAEARPALEAAELRVVYFAGRAVSGGGSLVLLPVDAAPRSAADLAQQGIDVDVVAAAFGTSERPALTIFDTSRRALGSEGGALSAGRTPRPGSDAARTGRLVAYAADPGRDALDGAAGAASPFTVALLKHLETPGVSVNTVFDRVRSEVFAATGGKQAVWVNTSLIGEVHLAKASTERPARGDPSPPPFPGPLPGSLRPPAALMDISEMRAWEAAERGGSVASYEAYLAAFPNGAFAGLARARVAREKAAQSAPGAATR